MLLKSKQYWRRYQSHRFYNTIKFLCPKGIHHCQSPLGFQTQPNSILDCVGLSPSAQSVCVELHERKIYFPSIFVSSIRSIGDEHILCEIISLLRSLFVLYLWLHRVSNDTSDELLLKQCTLNILLSLIQVSNFSLFSYSIK